MSDYTTAERLELCDLLDVVGPEHPTLCEGWTTHDLVAHLYVRESDPLVAPLMLAGKAESRLERAKQKYTYTELVNKVRTGPPRGSVFSLPKVGKAANLAEYFIHHEDVRRAGSGPQTVRALPAGEQDALWSRLSKMGKLLAVKSPAPLIARTPDGRTAELKRQRPSDPGRVYVTGQPSELMLALFGRGEAAQVEFDGPPQAVAAVRATSFGF